MISRVWRRRMAVLSATAVTLTGTTLTGGTLTGGTGSPAAAARPGELPVLAVLTSDHDRSRVKTVTAHCPDPGQSVYGAGARIIGGAGGVVLTAMAPDQTLSSVTVAAAARTGHDSAWSVSAYAVCDVSSEPPERTAATAVDSATATATCPDRTQVTGTGFRVDADVDLSYVDEVAPDRDLRRVRVHAGGSTPTRVVAYAICKRPTAVDGSLGTRLTATTATDGAWPKTAIVDASGTDQRVYGVGASVRGQGVLFLTALVPDPLRNLAGARADRGTGPAGAGPLRHDLDGRHSDGVLGDDAEGELTGYGILLHPTFH
ncbi:hypothetical protein EDC02_7407 [Micromonospora sp. Llam0]|nr:hypothetical protein EDC02_7407 [Micromonospora sp. Llam0]